jgi:hypothetical protein
MAGFDNTNTNQANTGGAYQTNSPWQNNFSGQLNDMLAPYNNTIGQYQQMAKQFQSPYMTMSPNSWLARNHPQVAGVLDNAFLTGAMTPEAQGPEGAGGGISRMMQGLMGGTQARRQQMIQSTMLPYQMAGAQLGAMDVASQIGERRAMVPFRMAQERMYDARSNMYYDKMAQGDRPKSLAGPDLTDDKGGTWSRVFDPVSGSTRLYNPVMQKHADELPEGQQPSFTKEQRSQRISAPGGLLGETYDMMESADPAIRAQGQKLHAQYIQDQSAMAGAKAGAVQGVTEPPKDLKTFVAQERQSAYGGLPKLMNQNEFQQANFTDKDYWAKELKNPGSSYQAYVKSQQATRQQLETDLSKYEKSDAPRKGVSYPEYLQDRSKWDGSAPNPAPAAASGTGSQWTPK